MRPLQKIRNILLSIVVLHIIVTLAYFTTSRQGSKSVFGIRAPEAIANPKKSAAGQTGDTSKVAPAEARRQEGIDISKAYRVLNEKRADLDRREDELNKRDERLQILQQDVEAKLAKLETVRQDILSYLSQKSQQEETNIKRLAAVYESIPPETAGVYLNGLSLPLASEVILRMDPKKAGKLMAFVKPEMAQKVSEYIVSKKLENDAAIKNVQR